MTTVITEKQLAAAKKELIALKKEMARLNPTDTCYQRLRELYQYEYQGAMRMLDALGLGDIL